MAIERYDEYLNKQVQRHQPIIGPVERAIAEVREVTGQEPVIIVVNQQPNETRPAYQPSVPEPRYRDQSALIFVIVAMLVAVALIAMIIVSCHAAPIIQQPPVIHDLRNCHFLC